MSVVNMNKYQGEIQVKILSNLGNKIRKHPTHLMAINNRSRDKFSAAGSY